MRFLKSTGFQFPNLLSTICSFLSPAILLHRKWEGDVSVWCSYRQRKISWVLRGSRLQDLRTWSPFQNFYLKNNLWDVCRKVLGNKVSDSITALIHIVIAISLKTWNMCLQYTWSGNIDVRYENFRSSFCTWGENQQSCWVATKFCYVHEC